MEEVKNRLKEALKLRSFSISELARRSGVDKASISRYLSGAFTPKQNAIGAMAEALNVNPAWLLGYDVQMEPEELQIRMDERRVIAEYSITDGLNAESLARLKSYADYLRSMQEGES